MNRLVDLETTRDVVVSFLSGSGFESEAQVIRRAVLNPSNRLACLFRAITSAEVAVHVNWGLKRSTLGPEAAEALVLLRAAALSALRDDDGTWMLRIRERVRSLSKGAEDVDQTRARRTRDRLLHGGS